MLNERNAMSFDDFKESKEASDWEEATTDWKEAVSWETDDSKG